MSAALEAGVALVTGAARGSGVACAVGWLRMARLRCFAADRSEEIAIHPQARGAVLADLAGALRCLAGPGGNFMTGEAFVVDGGSVTR